MVTRNTEARGGNHELHELKGSIVELTQSYQKTGNTTAAFRRSFAGELVSKLWLQLLNALQLQPVNGSGTFGDVWKEGK